MAEKLQKAMSLSLEDYIAEKGIVASLRPKPDATPDKGYFKRQLQSEVDEEEDDGDILFMEDREGMQLDQEEDDDLGDTPPPLIRKFEPASDHNPPSASPVASGSKEPVNVTVNVVSNNEMRAFVTEEQKRGIRHMPSQQWRLQRGNQSSFKKRYDPSASVKEIFDRSTDRLIASLGENARYRDNDARNRINNGRFGQQNNGRFGQQNNRRFRNNYGRNPGMTASFNPSFDKRNNQGPNPQPGRNQVADLRPMLTNQNQGGTIWQQQQFQVRQPQMMAFADMVHQMGQASSHQDRERFSSAIRNAMLLQQGPPVPAPAAPFGGGLSSMMMNPAGMAAPMKLDELYPHAAKTLLDHVLAVNQNFGPKYDMKVQKEIHQLQDKTLLYNSAGVVTMDGSGIDDTKFKPVTTDVSMNMRFS